VSTEIEPGSATPATVVPESAGEVVPTFEETVAEQMAVERSLWHTVMMSLFIAVPACVVIWLTIVALALGGDSEVSWGVWLAIGAIVGVLAGVFFGGLFTFVTKSHLLDETDRHAAAAKHAHATSH
jgi:type VI protein secretion system component VasK